MFRRFLPLFLLCVLMLPAHAQTRARSPKREFARAEAAWDKDDFAAAEAHFTSALNLSVGDFDNSGDSGDEAHAYFGRGLARLQQEKWIGARDDLTASIAIEPRNAEAFASRGMARKALGDYTGLLEDAHRATQIDPDYAGFEDDAKSTVNWRRAMLGFIVLTCILGAVGAVPMVRSFARVIKGESQARSKG